jgi:hypothetical protein
MASYQATWPSGITISWRDLTWQEYEDICGTRDLSDIPPEISVDILRTCVLSGPTESMITAGVGYFIAKHQIAHNPFSGDAICLIKTLQQARDAVNNDYLLSAQAMVANVFDYKIEELKTWTPSKFFLRVAQAEVIVGQQLNPAPPPRAQAPPRVRPSAKDLAQQRYQEGQNSS